MTWTFTRASNDFMVFITFYLHPFDFFCPHSCSAPLLPLITSLHCLFMLTTDDQHVDVQDNLAAIHTHYTLIFLEPFIAFSTPKNRHTHTHMHINPPSPLLYFSFAASTVSPSHCAHAVGFNCCQPSGVSLTYGISFPKFTYINFITHTHAPIIAAFEPITFAVLCRR